ncbi:MAG TPA: TrmH family RNA methyltransferase [Candidatus Paceibacterota bacterium]|nr:TrmH family RNA methyltransferase [Candidatus Paceibacterota bacterium]
MASALILHNIRSVHNVGSIFRTADAAGVSKVLLSGYTPAPVDRFNLPRKDFSKVSLGAEKTIPWEQTKTLAAAVSRLKKEGFYIVAVEQDKSSSSLFEFKGPKDKPLALVLGNEVRGVSKQSLKLVDAIVEIPMRGKKESLNVSVAAGIATFVLLQ